MNRITKILIFLGLTCLSERSDAIHRASLDLYVNFDNGSPVLQGRATYNLQGEACLYLPYNDDEFYRSFGRPARFRHIAGRSAYIGKGETELIEVSTWMQPISESLWKGTKETPLSFGLRSVTPQTVLAKQSYFLSGFAPVVVRCSDPGAKEFTEWDVRLRLPSGWQYAGVEDRKQGELVSYRIIAKSPAFAISRVYRKMTTQISSVSLQTYFVSAGFTKLLVSLQKVIPTIESMLGPYPGTSLVLMETENLETHSQTGIIPVNQPRQAGFGDFQSQVINWAQWQVIRSVVDEWVSGLLATKSGNQEWLLNAMTEYFTLSVLAEHPDLFDLFGDNVDERVFSLTYLQLLEITAATIHRTAPFETLTGASLANSRTPDKQHPMIHVRGAFALRQAAQATNTKSFQRWLRLFLLQHRFKPVSASDLVQFAAHSPSPLSPGQRRDIDKALRNWFQKSGWPDFSLLKFSATENQKEFATKVRVQQLGTIDFAPEVRLVFEDNSSIQGRAKWVDEAWQVVAKTKTKPTDVIIDPDHDAYDPNRFNNRSGGPRFAFFPGSADTLADDQNTVIWLPYPFRRPGEPLSFAVQGAMFRFTNGGLFANVAVADHALSEHKLRYRHQILHAASHLDVSSSKNYDNDAVEEISVTRTPILDWFTKAEFVPENS